MYVKLCSRKKTDVINTVTKSLKKVDKIKHINLKRII